MSLRTEYTIFQRYWNILLKTAPNNPKHGPFEPDYKGSYTVISDNKENTDLYWIYYIEDLTKSFCTGYKGHCEVRRGYQGRFETLDSWIQ